MKLLRPLAHLAPLALASMLVAATAQAAPTWITISDDAMPTLQRVSPRAEVIASRDVAVSKPESRRSARLVAATERVHAVQIEEEMLPSLSMLLHRAKRRCAGFVRHESMAEALAVLHRLEQREVRESKESRATTTQLLAPSYAIDDQTQVNALLPQMQASNILSTISQLSAFQNRRYNSSHGVAASNWLFNAWSALAPAGQRNVRVRQITHPNWPQKSVLFEILGSDNSGEVIVLGGHLDSISGGGIETARSPGADDDASGIASMTEVIRVLMANNVQPRRTLRFYAYAAEEVGLLGSQAIVASLAAERTRVVGVMQLDMTAYQGDSTDIWIYTDYTNAVQNQFLADLVTAYLPGLSVGYDACGYACSDHASWHNRGYVASFPFEASDNTYNFQIHTPNDTIATFGGTANHALKFAKLALAYAVELGTD
jgi:bacterial leucyl aminopeptidase